MKNFLIILVIAVLLVGFVVPQFFLSKSYAMQRSRTIQAPVAEIHDVVGDLSTWDEWTAWNSERDSTLERTITGEPGTPGHKMTWTGEELGEGEITLASVTPERIEYDMVFDGSEPARCAIALDGRDGAATEVTWEMSGEMGGMPFFRYFGLMMDGMVGPDFEEGLDGLAALVEDGSARNGAQGGARSEERSGD